MLDESEAGQTCTNVSLWVRALARYKFYTQHDADVDVLVWIRLPYLLPYLCGTDVVLGSDSSLPVQPIHSTGPK